MESVIALCASEQEQEQLVAVEALIHAAGKARRASFITANGVSLLKDLYRRGEKDSIRIRALVVRRVGLGWASGQPGRGPGLAGVSGCSTSTRWVTVWDVQGLVEAGGRGPGSYYHRAHGRVREMSLVQRGHLRMQGGPGCPLRAVGAAPGGDDGGHAGQAGQRAVWTGWASRRPQEQAVWGLPGLPEPVAALHLEEAGPPPRST